MMTIELDQHTNHAHIIACAAGNVMFTAVFRILSDSLHLDNLLLHLSKVNLTQNLKVDY